MNWLEMNNFPHFFRLILDKFSMIHYITFNVVKKIHYNKGSYL